MAIIADAELEAGFQVMVRWYAIAARRYPLDENDYYETYYETLQPNEEFVLFDERFDLDTLNEELDNIEYVIRDVCHVESLAPEYIGFDYIQPDYRVRTTLTQDYVANDLEVHVADASLFGLTENIQIGTHPSNVSSIMSINLLQNILVLTGGVNKSEEAGGIVANANIVADYPDEDAPSMVARILDNDGNLVSDPLEVTTPIYFDSTESPKRYFRDQALTQLFNGARGSGDTVDQIITHNGEPVRGGWWGLGPSMGAAADTAVLISHGGVVLATRSSRHAFPITLTYSGSLALACDGGVTSQYFANHSRFRTAGTEEGVTSFVTADSEVPPNGYYAWTSNLGDRVTIGGFVGDAARFNGTYFIAATTPVFSTGFDPDNTENNTVAGSLVYQKGDYYIWNRFDTQPNQGGWHISTIDPTDIWAFGIEMGTTAPQADLLRNLNAWQTADEAAATATFAPVTETIEVVMQSGDGGQRYVRFWRDGEFVRDEIFTGIEEPCPLMIPNSQVARFFTTEPFLACSVEGDGELVTLYYESYDNTFSAGQVHEIFRDTQGLVDLEAGFIQVGSFDADGMFVGTKYTWNGSVLTENTAVCNMLRYCNDPLATNYEELTGGMIDNTTCNYAMPICVNVGATNYLEPAQRTNPPYTEIQDAPVCTFPEYTAEMDITPAITGPAEGYSITTEEFTALNGTTYTISAVLELAAGYEWVSGPVATAPATVPGFLLTDPVQDNNATIAPNQYRIDFSGNLNASVTLTPMGQIDIPLPPDGSTIITHEGTFTGVVRRSAGLLTAMYDETINITGPAVGWSFNEAIDAGMEDDTYNISYELILGDAYEWITEPNNLTGSDTGTFPDEDVLVPLTITGELQKTPEAVPTYTVEIDVVDNISGPSAGYNLPSVQVTFDGTVVINSNAGGSATTENGALLAIFNEDQVPGSNSGYSFTVNPSVDVNINYGGTVTSQFPGILNADVLVTLTYTGTVEFSALPGCNIEGAFNYVEGSDGSVACVFGPQTWYASQAEYTACNAAEEGNTGATIITLEEVDGGPPLYASQAPFWYLTGRSLGFGDPTMSQTGRFSVSGSRADVTIFLVRGVSGGTTADGTPSGGTFGSVIPPPSTMEYSFVSTDGTVNESATVEIGGSDYDAVREIDFNLPEDKTYNYSIEHTSEEGRTTGGVQPSILIGGTPLTLYVTSGGGQMPQVGDPVYFTSDPVEIPSFTIPPGPPTIIPGVGPEPELYMGETWISGDGQNVYRVAGGMITEGPVTCPTDYTNFFDQFD